MFVLNDLFFRFGCVYFVGTIDLMGGRVDSHYCFFYGVLQLLVVMKLLVTTHDLLKRLDVREEVDIAILDFSKAFDVVPHKRLLQKLRLYSIEGHSLQWMISNL